MKKLLLIWSVIVVLGAMFVIFGIPALAQTADNVTAPPDQQAWQDMYQACQNGDWNAMADAAQRAHGGNWNGMMGGSW